MDLNIREFPDELAKALKMEALEREITLRELVIEKCANTVVMVKSEPSVALSTGTGRRKSQRTPITRSTGTVRVPVETKDAESAETGTEDQEIVDDIIYERNNRAQVPEDQVRYAAMGLCEHGREPKTCLACDWARRNK